MRRIRRRKKRETETHKKRILIIFRRHHYRRFDTPLTCSISLSTSSEMSEFEKFNLSLDDGKEFIDSKIFDFISGNTLQNRQGKLTSIVAEMVVGTTLKTDDLRNYQLKDIPRDLILLHRK